MFPVRLSDHVIRQSLVSKGVADQYLPFEEELDPAGDEITFDGHLKKGVLEQMYSNRVIFLLDMHALYIAGSVSENIKVQENRKLLILTM